ncbi:MAG: HPP family protein [Bacteriovoracaceae bacterium]
MKLSKDIMTTMPITIHAGESIVQAYGKMKENSIRHLPVMNGQNQIIGILSDRDIQRAMQVHRIDKFQQDIELPVEIPVEEFMSWPVYMVNEKTSIKVVAAQMLSQKVSAFLVEDEAGRLKGIITTDDLLKLLLEVEQPSIKEECISRFFTFTNNIQAG